MTGDPIPLDVATLAALVSNLQQEIYYMRPKLARIGVLEERVANLEKDLEGKSLRRFRRGRRLVHPKQQ